MDERGYLLLSYMYQWENCDTIRFPEYPDTMYTAPELNLICTITKAVDWWSFGVILYEMVTGLVSRHLVRFNIIMTCFNF